MQTIPNTQAQQVRAIIDHQSITGNHDCCLQRYVHRAPQALRRQLAGLGAVSDPLAIIDRHDVAGFSAYSEANFQIQVMNGDRPYALHQLVQHALQQPLTDHLVVVSDDPAFVPLCIKAKLAGAQVELWSPTDKPPPVLVQNGYQVYSLHHKLPLSAVEQPKAMVWLDAENLLFGLYPPNKRLRQRLDLTPIKDALSCVTHAVARHAYGDFLLLSRLFHCNVAHLFHQLNVVTHQCHSIRGKNSADMAIASAIHIALVKNPDMTTVVIGSGDGDFRPVAEHICQLGKRLVLLSLPSALHRELKGMAHQIIPVER